MKHAFLIMAHGSLPLLRVAVVYNDRPVTDTKIYTIDELNSLKYLGLLK
jgi:hypothetical protein